LGSDVKSKKTLRFFNNFFFKYYCSAIIVKSKELEESLKFKNIHIIPNGVDFKKFQEKNKIESLKKLNWNPDKINLIFGGNPNRTEKNFQLTNKTIKKFNDPTVELHILININHSELPYYFSAADGLILSSLWEGSPNIIKEAMACNLPIISTKVGDVEILFGNSDGHFLANKDFQEFYSEFQRFIFYLTENKRPRTKGLKQLIELQLSEEQIANKIIEVYKTVKNARYSNQ
jgi:glycosyltransferase involved in cell wall biosynthesis